jgi:hypothetical protein
MHLHHTSFKNTAARGALVGGMASGLHLQAAAPI